MYICPISLWEISVLTINPLKIITCFMYSIYLEISFREPVSSSWAHHPFIFFTHSYISLYGIKYICSTITSTKIISQHVSNMPRNIILRSLCYLGEKWQVSAITLHKIISLHLSNMLKYYCIGMLYHLDGKYYQFQP